jgi:hypothetical protein
MADFVQNIEHFVVRLGFFNHTEDSGFHCTHNIDLMSNQGFFEAYSFVIGSIPRGYNLVIVASFYVSD